MLAYWLVWIALAKAILSWYNSRLETGLRECGMELGEFRRQDKSCNCLYAVVNSGPTRTSKKGQWPN